MREGSLPLIPPRALTVFIFLYLTKSSSEERDVRHQNCLPFHLSKEDGLVNHVNQWFRLLWLYSGWLLTLWSFTPAPAEAVIGDNLKAVPGAPLTIKAETFRYDDEHNLLIAERNVIVTYQASRLTADRVEFNRLTGEAVASGHVRYEENGEIIIAERAELQLDQALGKLFVAELALQDDHYLTGRVIDKTDANTYLIAKGSYTACSGARPAWLFRCSQAKVEEGEYLRAWNAVGYIKGIPVIYLPYFIYPIKTERQTGFLIPEIGTNTSKGFSISNAFYWAISPSQDTTLRHTFYQKRGHKFDLEYRYVYSEDTAGDFAGQYIRDALDNEENIRLAWNHRHHLPYNITGRIALNWTSDKQFDEKFETRFEDRTQQYLTSEMSLTRNFSQHAIRLVFNRLDDLRPGNEDLVTQRIPELQITSQQQRLFGSPLYLSQMTQIARLQRKGKEKEELDFVRADIHPTLSLPVNLMNNALTITPRVDFWETYYTRDATTAADPDLDAVAVHREYYESSISVNGPKVQRIFTVGRNRRLQKIKHLIEPSLTFRYRPAVEELNLPKFDSIDSLGSAKQSRVIQYGITQNFLAKQVRQAEWDKFKHDELAESIDELPTEVKEWAKLSISQSYNFEAEKRNFSDITANLTAEPFQDYRLTLESRYDVYVQSFVRTYLALQGKLGEPVTFNVAWNREATVKTSTNEITEVRKTLNLATQIRLFEQLRIGYQGSFNIEEQTRVKDALELVYEAQCWDVSANYTQQLIKENQESSFFIRLNLKHLGKVFEYGG
jgi:LPS-assembly protein